jgi:hypothetical protein
MKSRSSNQNTSVSSVTEGLAKLIREVRNLQGEVGKLSAALHGFRDSRPRLFKVLPDSAGGNDRSRYETEEPRSEIGQLHYEYRNNPDLEVPTRTLLAIAKELDGALLDIRAARTTMSEIADDSDLRADFKAWQQANRSRR